MPELHIVGSSWDVRNRKATPNGGVLIDRDRYYERYGDSDGKFLVGEWVSFLLPGGHKMAGTVSTFQRVISEHHMDGPAFQMEIAVGPWGPGGCQVTLYSEEGIVCLDCMQSLEEWQGTEEPN